MPDDLDLTPPRRIEPTSLDDYFEVIVKAVFKSGMAWRVIDAKWDGIREAFHGFDTRRVAALTEAEVDALTQDARVIRNRRKLNAIVGNAARLVELEAEHGSIKAWLAGLAALGGYEAQMKQLRKEFKFLGEFGCYYFLYVVGEETPEYQQWREALAAR